MGHIILRINNSLQLSFLSTFIIETVSSFQILSLILKIMRSSMKDSQFLFMSLHKITILLTGTIGATSSLMSAVILTMCPIYLTFHIFLIVLLLLFRQRETRLPKVFAMLYHVHSRIIFYPVHFLLLEFMISLKDEKGFYSSKFSESKVSLIIGASVGCIINFLVALSKEFIFYQITSNKNFSSSKNNIYHEIVVIFKAVVSLISLLMKDNKLALQFISALMFLIICVLLHVLYSKLPFYKFQVLKALVIQTSFLLTFSAFSIIYMFIENTDILNGIHILSLVLPALLTKFILGRFRALFHRIIRGQFHSPEHSIHFALLLSKTLLEYEPLSLLNDSFLPKIQMLVGAIKNAGINVFEIYQKSKSQESKYHLHRYILEKLGSILAVNSNSQTLLIFMAEQYLTKSHNGPRALELIKRVESKSPFIPVQSSIESFYYKLMKINKKELVDNMQLEFSNYFKYNQMANSLKNDIHKEVGKHLKFWQQLESDNPDVKKVIQNAEKIDTMMMKIQKQYETYFDEFQHNLPGILLMYAVYLNNIRKVPQVARQVIQKYKTPLSNENGDKKVYINSWTTALAIVSMNSQKLGEIIDASGSIQNLFDRKKEELIGKNFGCLFPAPVAKSYQSLIAEFSRTSFIQLDYKDVCYGKTKNGDFFELETQFRLYPYLDKEMAVVLLFKALSNTKPIVIVKGNGSIMEYSHELAKKCNKKNINFSNCKLIQDLLDFDDLNTAFNVFCNEQEHSTLGYNRLPTTKENKTINYNTYGASEDSMIGRLLSQPNSEHNNQHPDRSFKDLVTLKTFLGKSLPSKRIWLTQNSKSKMTLKEAQKICNKYMSGAKLALKPNSENSLNKKSQLRVYIQVKPYLVEGEVYKIVLFPNKDNFFEFSKRSSDEQSPSVLNSKFADEFPIISETEQPIRSKRISFGKLTGNEIIRLSSSESGSTHKKVVYSSRTDHKNHARITHFEEQINSAMGITYRETQILKTLSEVSNKKKAHPFLKLLILILYLLVLIVGSLVSVNFHLSHQSIHEIQKGITVVNIATLRLQNTIKIWESTLLINAHAKGILKFPDILIKAAQNYVKEEVFQIASLNGQLKRELETMKDTGLLQTTFLRNIKMWIPNENHEIKPIETDTFMAVDILVAKYLSIADMINVNDMSKNNDDLFTFNNTANDFMISSKQLISETENLLHSIISRNISLLQLILALESATLGLLILIFLMLCFVGYRMYLRLFNALARIKQSAITERISEIKRIQTLFSEDIETRLFTYNALALFENNSSAQPVKTQRNSIALKEKKFITKNMNFHLIKLMLQASVFVPILLLLFIITLQNSLASFTSFTQVNNQVSVLSQASYQGELFLTSFFYDLLFYNNTEMLHFNKLPQDQLPLNLFEVININQKIDAAFFSHEIETDPLIEDTLKRDACIFLPKISESTCQSATKGTKTGLFTINEHYLQIARDSIETFYKNPTLETGLKQLMQFENLVGPDLSLLFTVYPKMVDYIVENFSKFIQSAIATENILFLLAFGVTITYLIYLHFACANKFKYVDISRRKVLKLIPYTLIQENRALVFYLSTEFKKEIEVIKNII